MLEQHSIFSPALSWVLAPKGLPMSPVKAVSALSERRNHSGLLLTVSLEHKLHMVGTMAVFSLFYA